MVTVCLEGGGNSKNLKIDCRKGFRKLFEKCGFQGHPSLVACGGRDQAFDRFKTELEKASDGDTIMLLVDSEDPVTDINRTWNHLRQRDGWQKPSGTVDEDVLLMTTCMETWIVADRETLRSHFGQHLQENALPPLNDLERRHRKQDILDKLEHATRNCSSPYTKGPKSFVVLGRLNPEIMEQHLPSFRRARRILNQKL